MLFVDSADFDEIEKAMLLPGVRGITTNPALFAKALKKQAVPFDQYVDYGLSICHRILEANFPPQDLMIQGIGTPRDIIEQADKYARILKEKNIRLWLKLLPTREAMSSIPGLKQAGVSVLITGVFTATQAYMAMEAGADAIAVYVGRMKRLEAVWASQLASIATVMSSYTGMFLLASFPDLETVTLALSYSRDLTIPWAVLEKMLENEHSQSAISGFNDKVSELIMAA